MVARSNIRTFVGVAALLALALVVLAACGGSSSTTTASSGTTSSSSTTSSTPAAGKRPAGAKPVSGTVTSYDASSKTLTVKASDGTTQTFTLISDTRIVKSQKITEQQLGSLVSTSGTGVIVMGPQAGANTYTAQEVVLSDLANGNGAPGRMPNGTPPARPDMNGTPMAGPNQGNGGPGGNRVIDQKGKLQNNQLIGQNMAGQTVTVNLSATTSIFQQLSGTVDDLKAGQSVTVNSGPAPGGNATGVRLITVGDLPERAAANQ